MTDDRCQNTLTTAMSGQRKVRTLDLWDFWVEAVEEDLLEARP